MPYGTIKVDTITFTAGGVDTSVSISGLVQNPTFTGNITSTGTISGNIIQGGTTVSGATVTGTTANFVSGVFTTQISGTTIRTTTGVFASGTAAAPSITFNGDLDTGLFTGAANTVGIAANGSAVLTVSGTNVGIGTSSPDSLLEISTSTATPQFLISNLSTTIASGGTIGTIDYRVGSSKTVVARLGATADSVNEDGAHIVFENRTAAGALTEKLRITSGGLVGIGTNSPVAQLETVGIVRSYRQVSGATSLLHDWYSDNGGTKILQHEFQAAGNAFHRGNVGIGTTSPNAKLQVNQNTDTATAISVVSASANTTLTTDFASLFLQNTNTTNNNYNTIGFVNDQGSYSASIHGIYTSHTAGAQSGVLAFATREGGTYGEKLRITAGGSVGIGTTGPGIVSGLSKYLTLSATGSSEAPGFEIVGNRNSSSSTVGRISFINVATGNNEVARINCQTSASGPLTEGVLVFSTSGTSRLVIDASGNVGIGTVSPSNSLQVSSSALAAVPSAGVSGHFLAVGSAGYGIAGGALTNGNSYLQVTRWDGTATNYDLLVQPNGGRVAIGTTNPDVKLHVAMGNGTGYIKLDGGTSSQATTGILFRSDTNNYQSEISSYQGNLQFVTGANERARIDSSGRLLIGTTSTTATNAKLVAFSSNNQFAPIRAGGSGGNGFSVIADNYSADESNLVIGVAYSSAAPVFCYSCKPSNTTDNAYLSSQAQYATKPGVIRLNEDGLRYLGTNTSANTAVGTAVTLTSRMLINSSGIAWFSSNNTFGGDSSGTDYHSFNVDSSSQWVLGVFNNASTGGYGVVVGYTADPNGTSNEAYYFNANNTLRFSVRSNGGIANYQANDVNLCDEREKKNIEDLQSTWDCLKHWELKKFHYNEDSNTEAKRYGVIAQQIEEHCPEVISEWVKQKAEDAKLDDDGNVIEPAKEEITRMAVKEQQMYWMAIKALQEAQVRIEQLEAKVAALESA